MKEHTRRDTARAHSSGSAKEHLQHWDTFLTGVPPWDAYHIGRNVPVART